VVRHGVEQGFALRPLCHFVLPKFASVFKRILTNPTIYAAPVRFYGVVSDCLQEAVEPISKGEGVLVVEEDGDLRVEKIG
jgi:hypothetical protein